MGFRWLHISYLRQTIKDGGQTPFCWSNVYIDARLEPLISSLPAPHFDKGLLRRRIDEIKQTIGATVMPPIVAQFLNAANGSRALEIGRRYCFSASELFQILINLFLTGRYVYTTTLSQTL